MSTVVNNITYTKVNANNARVTGWSPKTAVTVVVESSVVFPGETTGVPVTSIADEVFRSGTNLRYMTIPNSVTTIGGTQFTGNTLTTLTLSNTMSEIPFAMCYICNINTVTIPLSVTTIGSYAFNRSGLVSITIPENVTTIGAFAFGDNGNSLKTVTVDNPAVCTSVNANSFQNVSSFPTSQITFNNTNGYDELSPSWKTIANYFAIKIYNPPPPPTVTVDGITYQLVDANNATVSSASGIVNANIESTVSFPDSYSDVPVTTITSGVFSGNTDLETVTFSENSNITALNDNEFNGCSNLTTITLPSSVTALGSSAFYGCSSLTTITLPSSLTTIGDSAFYGCSSLTTITLPSSLTTIYDNSFRSCSSLASITLPSSITNIYDYAFYDCTSLTNVYVYNQSTCTVYSGSFTNVSANTSSQITFYNTASVDDLTSNWAIITNNFHVTHYVEGPPENPPTIGDLDIPNKTMGDYSPFEIVAPTSNSAGAFTYTSSDPTVATIVETNYIQIVGVGTTTITANQEASGNYTEGSVETEFTVSENSPSNPAIIGSGSSLVYFLGTGEDSVYANIDTSIVVTEELLLSASFKVMTVSDNSVTIVKNILD